MLNKNQLLHSTNFNNFTCKRNIQVPIHLFQSAILQQNRCFFRCEPPAFSMFAEGSHRKAALPIINASPGAKRRYSILVQVTPSGSCSASTVTT